MNLFLFETKYWLFIAKLLLSNIFFGYIIFMGLKKFFLSRLTVSPGILLLISLGLAPGIISLLLYYFLLLIPGQSNLTYLLLVIIPFAFIFCISTSELTAYKKISIDIKYWYVNNFKSRLSKTLLFTTLLFIVVVFAYLNYYINSKTVTEHDTLEYAVQGKIFFEDKAIEYNTTRFDDQSGFYYVGLHGFTFPLLASWERILNNVSGENSDLYFRSINMFFGALTLLILFLYLNRESLFLAIIGSLSLLICYGFFETFLKYHIDNLRIFYLIVALIAFLDCIKTPSVRSIIFFGILLGLQANSHSLGALICMIELCVLFLFINGNLVHKIKLSVIACCITILFGGVHYLLDVFTGTGWLFQNVKFF